MYYQGKRIILTGATGFIGRALHNQLTLAGADVHPYQYDVRDTHALNVLIDHSVDYVFHFAGPSSQILFQRNAAYCADVTINSFLKIAKLCQKNGVKLIYPSTGLLSQGRENEYARCKKVLEDLHFGMNLDALGLRIFAGYGPGEDHKRDYASVPTLFARDFLANRRPIVYGDGSQARDFIFIDDLVNAILVLAEECNERIVDVGSGEPISFNAIVKQLYLTPHYIKAPHNYINETLADIGIMQRHGCQAKTTIGKGLNILLEELRKKSL